MKERPILMNAAMVRAILDGRKTQTRRPLQARLVDDIDLSGAVPETRGKYQFLRMKNGHEFGGPVRHVFGVPGDRLWVRETWAHDAPSLEECRKRLEDGLAGGLPYGPYYRANPVHEGTGLRWRPSIHMPRWASRITLEITDVRVQRVQDITSEEAKAEGLRGITKDGVTVKWGIPDSDGLPGEDDFGWHWHKWELDPREAYRKIWASIYEKPRAFNWSANPWVWVIEFRRIEE